MDTCMNLLVTIDEKYIKPLIVMLNSYVEFHKDVPTNLYVVHSSLEQQHFDRLQTAVNDKNIHIHNIRITDSYFSDTPVLERLPEESFYRLLAFTYLPESVEKCLYLDPDIIIRKSLKPLYFMEMGETYIAAASHTYGFLNGMNNTRLGIQNERYVNSGIMLMNLTKIRESFTLEMILHCMEENIQRLIMGDQDMVNILMGHNMILLDERIYNLDERSFKYYNRITNWKLSDVEEMTAIIHYNGKYKPWLEGYVGVLDCFYPDVPEKGSSVAKGAVRGQIKSVLNIIRAAG